VVEHEKGLEEDTFVGEELMSAYLSHVCIYIYIKVKRISS
jgi:hypothetical protein